MTIVAWDGKYLAVDSRSTKKKTKISDTACKIVVDYEGCYLGRERIIATARAGNRRTTTMLTNALRRSRYVHNLLQKRYSDGKLVGYKKGSLFIVTKRSAWLLRVTPNTPPVLEEIGNNLFAMGSGAPLARFFMEILFLTPQKAVCATMLGKECCGGPVRYVQRKLTLRGVSDIRTTRFEETDELRRTVFLSIRRNCRTLIRDMDAES